MTCGIIPALQNAGAHIRAFDPAGMNEAGKLLSGVEFCDNSYKALEGADVLVIITEWNEFRALDLKRARELMNTPVMVDLRNIYDPDEIESAGFKYYSVGRAGSADSTE